MSARRGLRRHRDEAGYAAVLVALLSATVFLGMAALGVDTARWYVEVEQVQKAADAAALAGVTYMPNDMTNARATALAVAKKNGFDDASATVTVTVAVGDKPSELKVTISSRVNATFNLARALPNAKGQYLTFTFFDAADGASGTVKVLPPLDATGDVQLPSGVPGCKSGKNDASPSTYTSLTSCQVSVAGSYTDGQLIHMVIPIPNNYTCDNSTLGGCWFRIQLDYGSNVTDFTTWSAGIGGDPVRLIE